MAHRPIHWLFGLILLAVSLLAQEVAPVSSGQTSWYGMAGLSVSWQYLDIVDKSSDKTLGTFETRDSFWPILGVRSPYSYFENEHTGYYFTGSLTPFYFQWQNLDKNGSDLKKLGTSVGGVYSYVYASLFVNVGDRDMTAGKGLSFKAGIGLGAGLIYAHGDINLTFAPVPDDHDIDVFGFCWMLDVLFGELVINNWVFRARGIGPVFSDSKYEYDSMAGTIDFGYQFAF